MWYSGRKPVILSPALRSKYNAVDDAAKIIFKAAFYSYISRVKCGIPEVSQPF